MNKFCLEKVAENIILSDNDFNNIFLDIFQVRFDISENVLFTFMFCFKSYNFYNIFGKKC